MEQLVNSMCHIHLADVWIFVENHVFTVLLVEVNSAYA